PSLRARRPRAARPLPAPRPRRGRRARARDRCEGRAGSPARAPHQPPLRRRAAYALRAPVITAIYPGTYDPVTFGHVDVITRPAAIFDRLVIGVVGEPRHKKPLFSLDERVGFLRDALADLENVEVEVFSELVVDF